MWIDSMGTGKTPHSPQMLTHLLVMPKLFYQEAKVFSSTTEENVQLSKMTSCSISQIFLLLKNSENSKC